jgi:cytoskeleton protein RodZ
LSSSSATAGLSPQLQFTATDTSWIEVRDSRQQVIWRGVLKAGEMNRIATPETVHVVVGRAEVIQVMFKGQLLDLKPYTKVNVARFEVKP